MDTTDIDTNPTAEPPADLDPRPQLTQALATARAVVTDVGPDELPRPTPCGEMDVEALVGHLVAVVDRIEALGRRGDVGEVPPEVQVPLEGLPSRWDSAAEAAITAWSDDTTLDRQVRVPWDTLSGRDAVAIYVNELTVHTWDLARATDRSPVWDPDVVALSTTAIHQQLPSAERQAMWAEFAAHLPPEVPFAAPFGDAVAVPADAPAIDRLVAWNGRRP